MIERYFALKANHTTVKQELLGGLTTFITMAYIVIVNPQILSQAGVPADGALFATCLSAAVATFVMGVYANYPIALAPGMSLNAYFTYAVCIGMGVPWRTALGVVFFSGLLFLVLTVTRIREQIVNGIPNSLKYSTAAGIGMFIAFIGMRNAKLVVPNSATFVTLGNFADHQLQIACFGLALTFVLMIRKVRGSILIAIVSAAAIAIFTRVSPAPQGILSVPNFSATVFQLDLRSAAHLHLLDILFAFLFVDLFDNVGTLVGVCEQAGFVRDGKIPRVGKVLVADAVGTIVGSVTGTSTVTSYIESAAGVAAGARTGLSNIAVSIFFLSAMFFSPLASAIPACATAPALIVVGALMSQSVAQIEWKDLTEAAPAFITIIAMPLTFSIATGLSLGLICFTIVKLAAGRARQINSLVWALTALFVARYVYLAWK